MDHYRASRVIQTEQWVLETVNPNSVNALSNVDTLLNDLSVSMMSASKSGLQSSLTQYEELVKKQLSFNGEDEEEKDTTPNGNDEEGVFDKPLSEERQHGMRAVQSTLEKLDSKHGVLQRHASAECVRDAADETDYLKRTMSDSIRRSSTDGSKSGSVEGAEDTPPTVVNAAPEPTRSRQSSVRSDSDVRNGPPSRIPQPESPTKPQVKTPLTTNRTIPMTSSATKSQTHEPSRPLKVQAGTNLKDSDQDSPDKAVTMRQLLVESKAENSALKRQVEALKVENQRLKAGSDGQQSSADSTSHVHGKLAEAERRCDTLLREKENMATELWKLRQQVEELMNSKSEFGSEVGDNPANQKPGSGSQPDGALESKISDLESQVQDLQVANDTSSAEVLRLDQENQMLTAHIKELTSQLHHDADVERKVLEQQISELKMHQEGDDEVRHLKSELAQLRVDLKAMQEKTNILQEENVTLRQNIRDIKASSRWKGSGSSVNNTPIEGDSRGVKEAAWEEINTLKQKIKEFSARAPLLSVSSKSSVDKKGYMLNNTTSRTTLPYDRSPLKSTYSPREFSSLTTPYHSSPNLKKESLRPSYQLSNHSSDDRPPSPSGKSDVSESTTVLMAGFDAYKPLSRSTIAPLPRYSPPKRADDDAVSECTMDILNEATFNTQAFGSYDVNDDEGLEKALTRRERGYSNSSHQRRRSSIGSSSVQSESTQDLLLERLAPPASYGLRSVLVPVLPTQHNNTGVAPRITFNTTGRRPFAPRSPADLAVGDIAKFTKPDGRICRGLVKFVGHLHDRNDTYIGLELEYQDGKHDGMYDGVRYFDCKPNRGAFITFNKVIMVWGS